MASVVNSVMSARTRDIKCEVAANLLACWNNPAMDRIMTGRTDSASRVIHAPASVVYGAFVDGEALMRWLPPTGMRGELLAFEPHAGGGYRMRLTFEDGGKQMAGKSSADSDVVQGRYVELLPDRRIVQQADFESDDPAFAGTMTMIWTFEPIDGGTLVCVVCENVPEGISKADHDAGLASSLANLARFVEG
jgi:uncharacterized protein YndB with AHSA1/START domain